MTHKVTMILAQLAKWIKSIIPSISGNFFARWILNTAAMIKAAKLKIVGNHWLLAYAGSG